MATPFEAFVQLELGKRPYLEADGVAEAIFIRRGPGPKQMALLVLEEGQVIGKLNGQLTGISIAGLGGGASALFTFKQLEDGHSVWTITHGRANRYFTCNVFDFTGKSVIPDEIQIVDDNTISISFLVPTKGHAVFSFDPLAAT